MSHTIIKNKKKNLTWIDINNPTVKDRSVIEQLSVFSDSDIADAFRSTTRTKVTKHKDYIVMVMMSPVHDTKKKLQRVRELDILITKDTIVTVHYHPLRWISNMVSACSDKKYNTLFFSNGIEGVLFSILNGMQEQVYPMIDVINTRLDKLEDELFNSESSRDLVEDIVETRREITDMRRAMRSHADVIAHLIKRDEHENTLKIVKRRSLFGSLIDDANEIWGALESNKEIIEALEDANDALISHGLNDTIKTLTAVSVILLPASLLAGLFGVNAKNMPFIGHPADFWIIVYCIIFLCTILLIFFWRKGWLK